VSNRLEQEFPRTTWQAVPPLGPGGVPLEVVRQYMARGRQLRNRALRQGARAAGGAVLRGLGAVMAFVRGTARGLPRRRPPEPDCWTRSTRGA
jgi:hypothetical protein